jgi:hypothetical protein
MMSLNGFFCTFSRYAQHVRIVTFAASPESGDRLTRWCRPGSLQDSTILYNSGRLVRYITRKCL